MKQLLVFLSILTFSFGFSNQKPIEKISANDIIKLSQKVVTTLYEKDVSIAIVARTSLNKFETFVAGTKYGHIGFFIKVLDENNQINYISYNLIANDDLTESKIKKLWPVEFFTPSTERVASVIIPIKPMQKAMLESIKKGLFKKLHNEKYHLGSSVYDTKSQNCTEHILDFTFSLVYETEDISVIKLKQKKFLDTGLLKFATYQDIINFFKENEFTKEVLEIRP